MSVPIPAIALAADITFSDTASEWRETFQVVLSSSTKWYSHRSGHDFDPRITWFELEGQPCDGCYRVKAEFPLDEPASSEIGEGSSIVITIAASQTIARADHEVSEYLDLQVERTVKVAGTDLP